MPTALTAPTYILKGFVSYSILANNAANQIAPIGELSTFSQTFAKDTQLFGSTAGGSNPTAMDLRVFSSQKADGTDAMPPSDYVASILDIGDWMYGQALSGAFTADVNIFTQALLAQYPSLIESVIADEMAGQGNFWLPSSLEFFFTAASNNSSDDTTHSRIRLWFSDTSFQNEYDLYSIDFVPPITNLDDFFLSSTTIQNEVNANTLPDTMAAIAIVRDSKPETVLGADTFNWINPNNSTDYIPTNWSYLIWGEAGNNVDAVKLALQDYILANSTHNRIEWSAIFPDIFTSTEFILTPLWNQYAIPNKTLNPGMYMPAVNTNQALEIAKFTAIGTGYTAEYVGDVINVVPTSYKTLSMTAVGSSSNRGGITEFMKRWTDYLALPTTSTDFDRMKPDTQGFVTLLYKMLACAETMTLTSDMPSGLTRMSRKAADGNEVLYCVAAYNNVDYLVVAKSWLTSKYGETTNTEGSIGITYNGIYANGAYQLLSDNSQMTLQLVPINATSPNQWSILDTTISGATIGEDSGLMVGTFPSPDMYTVTVKLVDSEAHAITKTLTFNYQTPETGGSTSLSFGAKNIPIGLVGQSYSGSIDITGGNVPYAITNSTLPEGITATISGTMIILGGAPTEATVDSGMSSVIGIVDSTTPSPEATSLAFQFVVQQEASSNITFGAISDADYTAGTAYAGTVSIAGGTTPYTIVTYALPTGLTPAINGSFIDISGTVDASETGSGPWSVVIKDAINTEATASFMISSTAPSPTPTPTPTPSPTPTPTPSPTPTPTASPTPTPTPTPTAV